MSQILVTGEAKIRDIQGPVVANSGVITALDGAANQYVRGDGTLAIFPSSSGGGSSVSYYLNGSVNQGTFGGSTYYQMSRNAIVGTGTNFSTSIDGLIAQFITDANDPDVVSIPSGNWNVEFFMSVSASSGALASFYVEIYKYNGSTFTLLATNVATPEQLTNTTTVDAYFTSVAMPLSAMAVTDRLAIRIFANVASKTVTLYTEDNRLCQIVTTFSNGLTSLNNLTDQSQYLTTGTSGTDFNIVSSGDTHTFNLPVASATNTGKLSSTDWSTFNGKVPYTGAIADVDLGSNNFTAFGGTFNSILTINATGNQARALYMVTGTAGSQYGSGTGVNLFSEATDNLSILFTTASTTRKAILNGANLTTAKTFTLPDASGTIALTSNINYPVTSVFGRTGAVVAASGDYTTTQVTEGTNLYFTDARARAALSFTAGSGAYNSTTGLITIPTDNNQIANGAGYITSSALSGYLPLSGGTLTGGLNGTTATFSGLGTFYQLTMTGATAGRLFYAQTGGVFSQSGNLVWNNNTEQLGVGTPNPSAVVTAFSTNAATQLKAAGTAPAITFSNTLTSASLACVFGLATANNHFITGTAAGDMAIANQSTSPGAIIFGTDTFEKMRMSSNGNFGIATSSPATKLDVSGTIRSISQTDPTSGVGMELFYRAADTSSYIQSYDRTNGAWRDVKIYGNTLYFGSQGTNNLTIASTGAATFSSSVQTNGNAFILPTLTGGGAGGGLYLGVFPDTQYTKQAILVERYTSTSGNYGRGSLHFCNRDTADANQPTLADSRMVITSGGEVGIGVTPSSGNRFWVKGGTTSSGSTTMLAQNSAGTNTFYVRDDGAVFLRSSYPFTTAAASNMYLDSSGVIQLSVSSLKYKTDVIDYDKGLDYVLKLRPISYKSKNSLIDGDKVFAGLIAEEVHELGLTEFVQYAEDGTPNALAYQNMIALAFKAIQEQQAQIEELKELIKNK